MGYFILSVYLIIGVVILAVALYLLLSRPSDSGLTREEGEKLLYKSYADMFRRSFTELFSKENPTPIEKEKLKELLQGHTIDTAAALIEKEGITHPLTMQFWLLGAKAEKVRQKLLKQEKEENNNAIPKND